MQKNMQDMQEICKICISDNMLNMQKNMQKNMQPICKIEQYAYFAYFVYYFKI